MELEIELIDRTNSQIYTEFKNIKNNIYNENENYRDLYEKSSKQIKIELDNIKNDCFNSNSKKVFVENFFRQKNVRNDLEWITRARKYTFDFNKSDLILFLSTNNSLYYKELLINKLEYLEDILNEWENFLVDTCKKEIYENSIKNFEYKLKPFLSTYYKIINSYEQKAKEFCNNLLRKLVNELSNMPEYEYYLTRFEGVGNKLLNVQIKDKITNFKIHWKSLINNIKADSFLQNNIKKFEYFIINSKKINLEDIDILLSNLIDFNNETIQGIVFEKERLLNKTQSPEDVYNNILNILEDEILSYLVSEIIIYMTNNQNTIKKEIINLIDAFIAYVDVSWTISKIFGNIWNLTLDNFSVKDISQIIKFANLIEKDSTILKIVETLGKISQAKNEMELNKIINNDEKKFKYQENSYPEEFVGTKISNDITRLLPTELAYLKHPAFKKLFLAKYVDNKLMTFDYKNVSNMSVDEQEKLKNKRLDYSKTKSGPIILLVDISGSMHGTPEVIAKAVTIAMTALANRERRRIYLVCFATEYITLDLSDTAKNLETLNNFLAINFGSGGTDFSNPIRHALDIIKTSFYYNADVLMISDFIGDKLDEDVINGIKEASQNGNDFHGLVIGESTNYNLLKGFKKIWNFSDDSKKNLNELIKNLDNLAIHK